MDSIRDPEFKISRKAIHVYRMTNAIIGVIILIVLAVLVWAGHAYDWYKWINTILWVSLGLVPILAIWSIIIDPIIIQKYWRYGVDENFVRLKNGKFLQTDTVIPMTKIQYVEAEQGPILRRFGLYSLTIGTMRSSHGIPALPEEEAFKLRDQIAYHAKINEEDDSQ